MKYDVLETSRVVSSCLAIFSADKMNSSLLGWAIAADRDVFTLEEMVEAFDIKDVNPNPARFDMKAGLGWGSRRLHTFAVRGRPSPYPGACGREAPA